jgi:hypothetical protein
VADFDPKTWKITEGCNCPHCKAAREVQGPFVVTIPADDMNPKDKLGAAKPQMHLIPVGAMAAVARVMELGAKKYGPYNWRSKKVRKLVYAAAALRHLFAWIGGETLDPESGQSHLAHVAACMLIVLDAEQHGMAADDREWIKAPPLA